VIKFNFLAAFKGNERKMSTVAAHPVVWQIHHSCPLKKDKQLNMFLFKKLIQSKKHMFQSLRHSLQMLLMLMEI